MRTPDRHATGGPSLRDGDAAACLESEPAQPAATSGRARLAVARVDGASALTGCVASSPLQLFVPRPRGPAVWAVATVHGGGLVAGDAVALEIAVGSGAAALLGTLSENRVYRSRGPWAVQELSAEVAAGGLLALLPEPTSCFAGARYRQAQRIDLEPGASLLLLDWLAEGRAARGERWDFEAYLSHNRISIAGRPVLRDGLRLVRGEGPDLRGRMGSRALLATVVALGPAFAGPGRALLDEVSALPAAAGTNVLAAASPLEDGVYLRLAASTVAAGVESVRARLRFAAGLLGEDPFLRRP